MDAEALQLAEELKAGSREASWRLHDYVGNHQDSDHAALVPFLSEGLRDLETRDGCAFALQRIGPAAASAVPNLVTAMQYKPDDYVYAPFAEALGRIGKEAATAVPALVGMLEEHEDTHCSPVVIDAIVRIGIVDSDVLSALDTLARNGFDDTLKDAASNALEKLAASR